MVDENHQEQAGKDDPPAKKDRICARHGLGDILLLRSWSDYAGHVRDEGVFGPPQCGIMAIVSLAAP